MKRTIVAALILLVFTNASTTLAAMDPYKDIKAAVQKYNNAQFAWLHEPLDDKLRQAFLETVQPGSKADIEGNALGDRYIRKDAYLLDSSTHSIEFIKVTRSNGLALPSSPQTTGDNLIPTTAVVITEESSYWISNTGKTFNQTKNKHTYNLVQTAKGWKVCGDDYEPQQPG